MGAAGSRESGGVAAGTGLFAPHAGSVGSAGAVEDGADGIDVGVVGRLGEFEPEQHRQVLNWNA
jgi:hypothetical protein